MTRIDERYTVPKEVDGETMLVEMEIVNIIKQDNGIDIIVSKEVAS